MSVNRQRRLADTPEGNGAFEIEIARLDAWIVTHENPARTPGIHAVIDMLAQCFHMRKPKAIGR